MQHRTHFELPKFCVCVWVWKRYYALCARTCIKKWQKPWDTLKCSTVSLFSYFHQLWPLLHYSIIYFTFLWLKYSILLFTYVLKCIFDIANWWEICYGSERDDSYASVCVCVSTLYFILELISEALSLFHLIEFSFLVQTLFGCFGGEFCGIESHKGRITLLQINSIAHIVHRKVGVGWKFRFMHVFHVISTNSIDIMLFVSAKIYTIHFMAAAERERRIYFNMPKNWSHIIRLEWICIECKYLKYNLLGWNSSKRKRLFGFLWNEHFS